VAAAPTDILNSFAGMDGHGSGSILRKRHDIALRCDDENRSLPPLWPAVSTTGLTSLRIPRDSMKGNRLIVCLASICRPPEATGGEMRHRFGTPLHYAFGTCPVAVRCCQTAARKRSARSCLHTIATARSARRRCPRLAPNLCGGRSAFLWEGTFS
jgi:hypothetical protein